VYQALLDTEDMEYIIKRNEPCPCGSGSERKKCCFRFTKEHLSGNKLQCKCRRKSETDYDRDPKCMVCHCDLGELLLIACDFLCLFSALRVRTYPVSARSASSQMYARAPVGCREAECR